jgi:hypothetical protein
MARYKAGSLSQNRWLKFLGLNRTPQARNPDGATFAHDMSNVTVEDGIIKKRWGSKTYANNLDESGSSFSQSYTGSGSSNSASYNQVLNTTTLNGNDLIAGETDKREFAVRFTGVNVPKTIPKSRVIFNCNTNEVGWANKSWLGTDSGVFFFDTTIYQTPNASVQCRVYHHGEGVHNVTDLDLTKFYDGSSSTTDDYIHLWLYIDASNFANLSNTSSLQITFNNDTYGIQTNYFSYNITKASLVVGWNEINVAKSTFTTHGSANWDTLKGFDIHCTSDELQSVFFYIDDIQLVSATGVTPVMANCNVQLIGGDAINGQGTLSFSPALNIEIAGEDVDNSPDFSTYSDWVGRTRTTAKVTWSLSSWQSGVAVYTADISPIIQEIINRSGWVAGNAITLFFRVTGDNGLVSFTTSPTLHLEYLDNTLSYLTNVVAYSGTAERSFAPEYLYDQNDPLHISYPSTVWFYGTIWQNVTIPQRSIIQSAYVHYNPSSGSGNAYIGVMNYANAPLFNGTYSYDIQSRPTLGYSDIWSLATLNSPSISTYVQSIVNKSDWSSGNNIGIITYPNGTGGYTFNHNTTTLNVSYNANNILEYTASSNIQINSIGATTVSDSFLWLGRYDNNWIMLRFTGVNIPPNAVITSAMVSLHATNSDANTVSTTIYGQLGTTSDFNTSYSGRTLTKAYHTWNIPSITSGTDYNTTNISNIVQEIIRNSEFDNTVTLFIQTDLTTYQKHFASIYSGANVPVLSISWVLYNEIKASGKYTLKDCYGYTHDVEVASTPTDVYENVSGTWTLRENYTTAGNPRLQPFGNLLYRADGVTEATRFEYDPVNNAVIPSVDTDNSSSLQAYNGADYPIPAGIHTKVVSGSLVNSGSATAGDKTALKGAVIEVRFNHPSIIGLDYMVDYMQVFVGNPVSSNVTVQFDIWKNATVGATLTTSGATKVCSSSFVATANTTNGTLYQVPLVNHINETAYPSGRNFLSFNVGTTYYINFYSSDANFTSLKWFYGDTTPTTLTNPDTQSSGKLWTYNTGISALAYQNPAYNFAVFYKALPKCKYMTIFDKRIWYIDVQEDYVLDKNKEKNKLRCYVSQPYLGNALSALGNNIVELSTSDTEITSYLVSGNRLYLATEHNIFVVSPTGTTYPVSQMRGSGVPSPDAMVELENDVFYSNRNGFFLLGRVQQFGEEDRNSRIDYPLYDLFDNISQLGNIKTTYFKGKIFISTDQGTSTNTKLFIYNYGKINPSWEVWDIPVSTWQNDGDALKFVQYGGQMYQFDKTLEQDDGVDITWNYTTLFDDYGVPDLFKMGRWIDTSLDITHGNVEMFYCANHLAISDTDTSTIDRDLWDSGLWDTATWDYQRDQRNWRVPIVDTSHFPYKYMSLSIKYAGDGTDRGVKIYNTNIWKSNLSTSYFFYNRVS